jgi:L-alanine-DL-glutamate epimerase-like enolase superfamily enzyme
MEVSETFVLNALVPLDLAIWSLYSRKMGYGNFDGILNAEKKCERLANIPLITYSARVEDALRMANDGTPIFKIKIGSDPDGDGDPEKMLEWDKARALEIHTALRDIETDLTDSGRIVYYFDANGRYDTRERLESLLSFFEKHGILERTVLLEEPFNIDSDISVEGLPVCVAADESAHSVKDVKRRIELGYGAITLKPIAKTLTVTLEMLKVAEEMGVQCFTADLTVNPVMIEWNKSVAARLKPLRGMKIGVVESNGAQNYANWQRMLTYLEKRTTDGAILTSCEDDSIFKVHSHYLEIATRVADK